MGRSWIRPQVSPATADGTSQKDIHLGIPPVIHQVPHRLKARRHSGRRTVVKTQGNRQTAFEEPAVQARTSQRERSGEPKNLSQRASTLGSANYYQIYSI